MLCCCLTLWLYANCAVITQAFTWYTDVMVLVPLRRPVGGRLPPQPGQRGDDGGPEGGGGGLQHPDHGRGAAGPAHGGGERALDSFCTMNAY